VHQPFGVLHGARCNEDGIVASDRPEDKARLHRVDHFRNAMGAAGECFNNDHRLVVVDTAYLVAQKCPHPMVLALFIKRIARTFSRRNAANAHFGEIARERRLIHIEAGFFERALQIVLRTQMLFRDEFTNGKLPLVLARARSLAGILGLAHGAIM